MANIDLAGNQFQDVVNVTVDLGKAILGTLQQLVTGSNAGVLITVAVVVGIVVMIVALVRKYAKY